MMTLLSNSLSWPLIIALWMLIPYYRLSTNPLDRALSWLYFFLGFSLGATALLRYVEGAHDWVLLGGAFSKFLILNTILVVAHKTHKRRNSING